MYRIAKAEMDVDSATTLSAQYTYTDDLLTAIQTGSTTYSFSYGAFALRSSIQIGSRTLANYSYDNRNRLQTLAYGNGDSVQYSYDSHGRVTKETYEGGDTVSYKYDNSGALASVTDSETGITTTYYYDFTDRMMKYVEKSSTYSHSVGYEYDQLNNLTSLVETINGVNHTTTYAYDDDNRTTSVTTDGVTVEYTYDGFGRVSQQATKNGSATILTEYFTYTSPTGTTVSTQIATYRTVSAGYDVTYTYTYDNNGNILSISDGTNTTSYVYDAANQLVRENNQAAGYTHTWTYDDAGNILEANAVDYTLGEVSRNYPIVYNYDNTDWGDLLTAYSYDGELESEITYDAIGNPISDSGISSDMRSFVWEHGRQLSALFLGDTNFWEYAYNGDGLRTSRLYTGGSHNAIKYRYVYNGSNLAQLFIDHYDAFPGEDADLEYTDVLYFTYDATGAPVTVKYNDTIYYYVTNIQGDVVGVVDGTGAQVVSYTYDAWGMPLSRTGTMADTLGYYNPLRYRGYVYDQETGLYYVSSRYYDPEIGRWINADSVVSGTGGDILGYNLYTYCFNNPVNMSDPTGNWPKWIKNTVKWVAKNIINPIVKSTQSLLNKTDIAVSTGKTVGVTLGIIDFSVTPACVSIDTKGNVELQVSVYGGFSSSATFDGTIGKTTMISNVSSVENLRGSGEVFGGSFFAPTEAGIPLGGGIDINRLPAPNKAYWGIASFVGLSTSPGGSVHIGESYTIPIFSINIFSEYDRIYDSVMGW